MKRLIYTALTVAAAGMMATGCDSDADKWYVDGLEESTIHSSANEIELSGEDASKTAVSFTWSNESKLILHGPSYVGIADKSLPTYTIEFSLTEDFKTSYTESVDDGIATYTVQSLNTIVRGLGANANERVTVYVRLKTALSANSEDYNESNVVTLYVTPYKIDYTKAKMLSSDQSSTIGYLYSADTDGDGDPDTQGLYSGFYGAGGWANWYLQENDGTIWGNVGEDGNEFKTSSDVTCWNFWYPGNNGCYYTIVDVSATAETKAWTAVYIPSLSLSGDVSGDMTYIRNENRWMCTFTTTADGQTFSISGTGKEYNYTTGTDDSKAVDYPVTFGAGSGDSELEFQGNGVFTVAKAGTYTINLYLSDFSALNYKIASGAEEVVETAPEQIYMSGLNDVWGFNFPMALTDEDNWVYNGVFGVNSCPWGYQFLKEQDNWGDGWCYGGTDGTLKVGTDANIEFTSTGVYAWTADLKNLTYSTTKYDAIYCAGFNDDWSLISMTADESSACKYTASVTISKASSYGFQIVLGDWAITLGGEEGKLDSWKKRNITDDQSLEAGDYTLTVDFATMTYTLAAAGSESGDGGDSSESGDSGSETTTYPETLYAIGMNDDWEAWVAIASTGTGTYSGTITATKKTDFKVFGDQSWDSTLYGPSDNDGNLTSGSSAWKFWVDSAGTYTLTIDLTTNTYTLTLVE